MKRFIAILGFLFYAFSSGSQSQEGTGLRESDAVREFDLTVSSGFSFFGPKNDMESAFISAGFDDTSPAGWGGGATAHPFTRKGLLFEIEATYYFNGQLGISANGGMINNIEVLGYKADVGLGDFLFLDSKVKSLSLSLAYRTKNNRHTFFLGPLYSMHKVKDVSAGNISPESNNRKAGAYLGYTHAPFMRRHWAVVLKAGYRWTPKSTIGPFSSESGDNTSEFLATDVSISCLNIGIGLMLRIPRQEPTVSD